MAVFRVTYDRNGVAAVREYVAESDGEALEQFEDSALGDYEVLSVVEVIDGEAARS
jgi:hypothetical protein